MELLYYQYFIEGNDIGDLKILIQIAKETKVHDKNFETYILSQKDNKKLINEEEQARKIGITGVPCFIFNKEFVVNGAQSEEYFIQIINSINKDA
mgnify:CR=1 FL=1